MADKEVSAKDRKNKVREESFGSAPPKIAVEKGEMCTFGYKANDGVWPPTETPVNVKTGFPRGFDKKGK